MVSTYYTIQFYTLDRYECTVYDSEIQYDTEEEANKAFCEWVAEDQAYGVDEYVEIRLYECGNGKEPIEIDNYEFEGTGEYEPEEFYEEF